MEWDQIESKWAAMTRRVRGDLHPRSVGKDATGPLRSRKTDALRDGAAEPGFAAAAAGSDTMPAT